MTPHPLDLDDDGLIDRDQQEAANLRPFSLFKELIITSVLTVLFISWALLAAALIHGGW